MAYKELDTKSVVEYLKTRPALAEVLPVNDEYEASEIGDGNLNMVFIIQSKTVPERTVIVKQALPYLRVVGESWPLTRDRIIYETEALKIYNEIAPEFSPIVYDNDYDMSVAVMENLNQHEIMRKPLVSRERFPKFAEHISSFLANVLFKTSDLYLSSKDKKALQEKFMNPELRKLQEDFVYTNPFMEAEENNWNPLIDDLAKDVRSDGKLKQEINKLKIDYVLKAQALLHADLHTGSIMLNKEETKVIDPEFAFVGPMAYDIAAVIQNLILNYASHFAHTKDTAQRESYQDYLLETIRDIWNGFALKFDQLWQAENQGDLSPNSYWDFEGGEEAFAEFRKDYL
ncbi:MAG TPA: S-methyl-5-thioribose kinase, partial [Trueperaceae bacterium]|nr:S-methyl-5-thioribose kinase [Trueperaceae bacterium]